MKAAQITGYGGKDVVRVSADVPRPTITDDEVLIAVHAAGVNPFDWKVQAGYMQQVAHLQFPATLGGDFAGVVAEVGKNVTNVTVGDEVYGQAEALSSHGSFAEFTPAKASKVALKPKNTDFITAACLPLTGVSAYQALVEHAKLQASQKILIHGGAGGIGSSAVQLAKHLGAYVATTAAAEAADFVKSLGADQVIDYKTQDFTELIKDYDVVYDLVDGNTYTKSYRVLKPGGVIVSMLSQPNEALMKQFNVTAVAQHTEVTTERLAHLAELVDDGTLKPQIDKVFSLDQAAEALSFLQQGQHHGRVVIQVIGQ